MNVNDERLRLAIVESLKRRGVTASIEAENGRVTMATVAGVNLFPHAKNNRNALRSIAAATGLNPDGSEPMLEHLKHAREELSAAYDRASKSCPACGYVAVCK